MAVCFKTLFLLLFALHWTQEELAVVYNEFDQDSLILTHVLFRHGNRTADRQHELYPNDPYLNEPYFPYGNGQLTKVGKKKEYDLGKSLRARYNTLLGDQYDPMIVDAYSTDYNRTKMSLQLVLAGLFPPKEEDIFENGLLWQPVPFNYLPKYEDKVLLGVLCPNYLKMYDEVTKSEEMQKKFAEHANAFRYISEHSGLNVTRFYDLYNLYFGLSTEEEYGLLLPEWTQIVWPETITNLAIQDYFVSMTTDDMVKMASGYYIEKIIQDTIKKIISSDWPGKRIYLYSAHENNIAELLISLNLFNKPHVPNYGAWISIEIHFINNVYGVKIYYENYTGKGPELLTIPDCESFCPLDKFIALTSHLIPSEDLCGI
ncbi:venom acid phosphatase Acph-1-like [Rhynchophorus ferrugineus]|uniref:venom acid phosphatase Acph-1-like n=1 Tax=Rhynchophorus ferrugineus TaxID=354439 RepID=UPI003FCEB346